MFISNDVPSFWDILMKPFPFWKILEIAYHTIWFIFYWGLTSLQCCVDFCCTTLGISSMCIASLLSHPPSSPHPTLLGHHRAPSWAPCAYSSFPLASYFTQESVYMSVLRSQFISPSPSRPVSTSLFSTRASSFLPCKQIHRPHFPLGFIETRMQRGFFFFPIKV